LAELTWQYTDEDGTVQVRVESDTPPEKVEVWTASSESRDFREAEWTAQPTRRDGKAYVFALPRPASGWSALFGEASFAGESLPYYLSTTVKMVEGR
jgi:PhoPQ-activated pathogenicity-related protein